MAVYLTLLKPGDTVLGMNLAHGGHLTHGHPLNFSGQALHDRPLRRAQGRRADRLRRARPARRRAQAEDDHRRRQRLPARHRLRAHPRGRRSRSARPMFTDMAHIAGLVAAGVHPSPVPHSDFVTTTTHKTLRGPRGGLVLCREQYAKDLDRSVFPGVQGGPLMHIIAAKAVCFKEAAEPAFADYQRQIVANAAAARAARSSAPGFRLVSGGTDNHLMLVDVFSKGITGKVAEAALGKAGITVNKNAIPFDQNPPMVASGIRIGTPAVTTRGMREPEMDVDRRAHRARAARRRTTIAALGDGPRRKSRRCAGSSRCTRNAGSSDPDRRHGPRRDDLASPWRTCSRPAAARARVPDFEPRAGQVEMAAAVARVVRGRRRPPRRSRHRHRQDARLPRPRDPQPPARAHLDRHQEPPGADLLQGHPGAARRARRPVHRDLHEGARELPVPAPARSADATARRPGGRTTCSCRSSASGRRGPRPAIAPSSRICPRILPFWNEVSATAETCLGTECPRYDDCFVTRMRQRAAASDVVIVNHHLLCADAAVRQSAYGEVIPACSRAIVDEAHQLEDVATQYFGFSVSNYRVEELARDVERLAAAGAVDDRRRAERDRQGGRAAARPCARVLRRARVRAPRRRGVRERRAGARDRPRRSADARDAGAPT